MKTETQTIFRYAYLLKWCAKFFQDKTAKLRFLERLIQGVSQALDDISLDVEAGKIGTVIE
jgi:hypothetical protein